MTSFVEQLRASLLAHADLLRKSGSEAYLRNQFTCIGVDTTKRRLLLKDFLQHTDRLAFDELIPVIKEMWQLEREMQLCAIEIASLYKKDWPKSFIETIELCILSKSWWDSVDHICSEWIDPYFRLYPGQIKKITGKWNRSDNIWLQRSSIMFQKKFRQHTDVDLLSGYILNLAASNEFFVMKAIGWALREYGKTNPDWVRAFVNANKLKPLSKKEALKNL